MRSHYSAYNCFLVYIFYMHEIISHLDVAASLSLYYICIYAYNCFIVYIFFALMK